MNFANSCSSQAENTEVSYISLLRFCHPIFFFFFILCAYLSPIILVDATENLFKI